MQMNRKVGRINFLQDNNVSAKDGIFGKFPSSRYTFKSY